MKIEPIDLLPAIEIETGKRPIYTIVWMHGLGADGNDFVPIVQEFELSPEKHIRFIFPHAPKRPISINNGYIMRAWYDIFHPDTLIDSIFSNGIHFIKQYLFGGKEQYDKLHLTDSPSH